MRLVALYRKLLWLYPKGFRDEFGGEMAAFFEERLREASSRGRLPLLAACARGLLDLVASAAAERWSERRRPAPFGRKGKAMLNGLGPDLVSALRAVAKRPGLTATVVATLALGLGAVSVVFAVVDAALLRPLPYGAPDRIVTIWNRYGTENVYSSPPDYVDRRERASAFSRIAAVAPTTMNLTGGAEPRHVVVARVSTEFFDVFGATDRDGTPLRFPDELGGEPAELAVLSYGLWQSAFGGRDDVRGAVLALDGEPFEIVGVLPEGFDFPGDTHVYVPLVFTPSQLGDDFRGNEYLLNVGLLRPGVSLETARSEAATIAAGVLARVPERRGFLERNGWSASVVPLREHLTGNLRPALVILVVAVLLVLAVCGANVVNLMVASLSARESELAVRSTLGASRFRLARQLLLESLLLSGVGAACGLLLSTLVLSALPLTALGPSAELGEARLDVRTLGFTVLVGLLSGALAGVLPAWRASAGRLHAALRDRGAGRSATGRRVLVASEVALAVTLLGGTGLLVRSFEALTALDPGFVAEGRVTFRLQLPTSQYPSAAERVSFQRALLERLRAAPGVASAAISERVPLDGSGWGGTFHPEGYAPAPGEPTPGADFNRVSPGYFETLGIPLLAGRDFSSADSAESPSVVIVDRSTAARFWPEGAVGRRINMSRAGGPPDLHEIVGVVGHVKTRALEEPGRFQIYFPGTQSSSRRLGVTLHAGLPLDEVVARARAVVAELDPGLPIHAVRELEELVADSLALRELQLKLLSAFALLAALLAAVGLYGVLSYSVGRRRRELGVRVAMGARTRSIAGLVLKEALVLVAFGLAVGLSLSVSVARFFEQLLFGVRPTDPATLLVVGLSVLSLALVAAWLPARRAARVDPVDALRS